MTEFDDFEVTPKPEWKQWKMLKQWASESSVAGMPQRAPKTKKKPKRKSQLWASSGFRK